MINGVNSILATLTGKVVTVAEDVDIRASAYRPAQTWPLTLILDGEEWLLPLEPMISMSLRNNIVKRNVSKGKLQGTIKERWSQGDWAITINGSLVGTAGEYPRAEVEKLYRYVSANKAIKVKCEPLQIAGINFIVIEDLDVPFTKGEDRQQYSIKAVSDFEYDLFIDLKI